MSLIELNGAIAQGEESPIATHAYALARMVFGAALTHDDAAGENFLTAKQLDAETLRCAIATVAR